MGGRGVMVGSRSGARLGAAGTSGTLPNAMSAIGPGEDTVNLRKKLAMPAAVICTALLTPLTASAATPTWTVMPTTQEVQALTLTGVACPSVTFCLAIGANGPQPLVFEWNGSTWAFQTTLGQPDSSEINAISCASATYCVAAGFNFLGPSAGSQATVWVWNGSSWLDGPNGTASSSPSKWSHLYGVKCLSPSDCEVVGNQSAHQHVYHPLAEVWNGSTLTAQPVQGPHGPAAGTLDAVACTSAASCEAVGQHPQNQSDVGLAARWNGTTWSTQKLPTVTGRTSLSGLSCYRTGCTAVGTVYTTRDSTLAEAWNGSRWALQSPIGSGNVTGATGIGTIWNAVHCRNAANCTVVGTWGDAAGNAFTLAETWNGSKWAKEPTPSPGSTSNTEDGLNALSHTPGTSVLTAVGAGGVNDAVFAERN
jgi:hypothetical protein